MTKLKYFFTFILLSSLKAFAQRPREIMLDNDPLDFSDPAILIGVVIIPIVLAVLGIILFLRQRRLKKAKEEQA